MQGNKKIIELSKYAFSSSTALSGSSTATIYDIKKRLEMYHGLELISEGTILKYLIDEATEVKNRIYLVEISRQQVRLTMYSNAIEPGLDTEPLLRLLSISQILSDLYKFDISSIFPNLIAILSRAKLQPEKKYLKEAEQTSSNSIEHTLARRIIKLLMENDAMQKELNASNTNSQQLLSKLIMLEFENRKASVDIIAEKYMVGRGLVEEALRNLEKIGYKRLYSLQGFTLVRE
jgi:ribosomal protein S25